MANRDFQMEDKKVTVWITCYLIFVYFFQASFTSKSKIVNHEYQVHHHLADVFLQSKQVESWFGNITCLPLHTSPSPSELGDNDHIVSCFFPRSEGCPKRRLSCCFDRTYLSSALQLCHTSRGHTLCGPPHFIQEDQSQIVIRREKGQEQFRISDLIRANEVESIVCWDTSRQHSGCFEVSAMPVTSAAARMKEFEDSVQNPKNKRGQFETCHRMGMILQHCESIRFLICDSHGSHEWVKKLMLGMDISLPESLQSQIPFFKDLVCHDLPKCNFVLGYRSVSYKGEAVFWMPGQLKHIQVSFNQGLIGGLGPDGLESDWIPENERFCDLGVSLPKHTQTTRPQTTN